MLLSAVGIAPAGRAMEAAHYAPESIICAVKYNHGSCCVLVQVFISVAVSVPADVPSSPLQSVLAPGAGAASVPAAVAVLSQRAEDQDVQLRCPCFGAGCVTKPAALSPSTEAALSVQDSLAPKMCKILDECLDVQSIWLLFMDLIAGEVAAVSPAEQVWAVLLWTRGTCRTG